MSLGRKRMVTEGKTQINILGILELRARTPRSTHLTFHRQNGYHPGRTSIPGIPIQADKSGWQFLHTHSRCVHLLSLHVYQPSDKMCLPDCSVGHYALYNRKDAAA